MRNERDLLKRIGKWIEETPENKVKAELALRGLGGTTIRELLNGTYKRSPQGQTKLAFEAILEDVS